MEGGGEGERGWACTIMIGARRETLGYIRIRKSANPFDREKPRALNVIANPAD